MKHRLTFLALTLAAISCSVFSSSTHAQDGTEIYLMDNIRHVGLRFGNINNITNTSGYDNQPCFSADQTKLYFTSMRDGEQADIYAYNIASKRTVQVTATKTSEYSPTPIPGRNTLCVVRVEKGGKQRLWELDPVTKKMEVIAPTVDSVGYFCWIDENRIAVFVITKKPELRIIDLKKETETTVASNIGRCIQKIPGTNDISYLQLGSKPWKLCSYDPDTLTNDTIYDWILPESEDYAWLSDGTIFTGYDGIVHGLNIRRDTKWDVIEMFPEPHFAWISRLAIAPDEKQFAIVFDE